MLPYYRYVLPPFKPTTAIPRKDQVRRLTLPGVRRAK